MVTGATGCVTAPTEGSVPAPESPSGPSSGGSELDWFLGSALPPDVLIAAQEAHLGEIAQCMIDQGFDRQIEPLEYSDEMRLRYDDPVTFAQSCGYGFFTVGVERVSSVDELDVEHPEVIEPTDDWLAARESCDARHPYPLIEDLAGVGVSTWPTSSDEHSSRPTLATWLRSMRGSSFMARHEPSVTTADGALGLVAARLDEFPNTSEFEGAPGTSIINDTELAELVDFERAVDEIDTACGEESGRYEAERVIDRQVIDTIRAETGYDGVHLEPAT